MDELKKLIEALGRTFEEFKTANDLRIKAIETKGYAPADVEEKVEKTNARMTKIADQIDAIETAIAKSDMKGGGSSITAAQKAHMQAFEKWFRKGGDGPATAALLNDLAVKAELSTLSDPDGGFITAPPVIESTIDRVASTMSAMRRISSVISINADAYKKFVNQGGNTHGWVGEKQARTETNTPTLTEIVINVKEI